MKSHPYATKRRLTNICCLVAGLGLAKIIVASYMLSNGEFFTSEEVTLDPRQAYLAQESQKNYNDDGTFSENSSSSTRMTDTVDYNFTASDTTIRLMQKSQNTDNSRMIGNAKSPEMTLSQTQNTAEASDLIDTDFALAHASNQTITNNRDRMRASVLSNALAQNAQYNEKSIQALQNDTTIKPQYQTSSIKPRKSSLLSFVDAAHAEEYVRPDENIDIFIPPPTIAPYQSPDSLEYKEAELNRKEEELLSLEQQMDTRMNELTKIENRLDTMVNNANQVEDTKFKHLIGTYTNMKAKKAAIALTTLDENIAVRILFGMKSKQSGEIFSYMDPLQAARLSEAMAKLRM